MRWPWLMRNEKQEQRMATNTVETQMAKLQSKMETGGVPVDAPPVQSEPASPWNDVFVGASGVGAGFVSRLEDRIQGAAVAGDGYGVHQRARPADPHSLRRR